ncbi:MAG: YHS domain-containing (seleno)protein [Pseudomonadota bacterium]
MSNIDRREVLRFAIAAGALGAGILGRPGGAQAGTIFSEFGVAIRGADPVAFFTEQDAVEGLSRYRLEWQGAKWQFASAANRDRFAADPEAFMPQYGGWCAWAMTKGDLAPTDPTAWLISDGKLYLNYNRGTEKRFRKDVPGNIAKANAVWREKYA